MSLEEAILERVRRLPPAKQEQLLRLAEELQRSKPEMRWMTEHRSEYVGQWVALEGYRLIAAGPDPLRIYAAAKEERIETLRGAYHPRRFRDW